MLETENARPLTGISTSILETAPAYMYQVTFEDGHPCKRFHSAGCETILSYSAHEYESDPNLWLKMIHAQDRDRVLDFFHDLHESGQNQCCEITHRIVRKNGTVLWALNRLTKTVDFNTGKVDLTGIIVDVTSQKEAEFALREGERRYRELFENANDIVFTMDNTGRITDINRAGLRRLGYEKHEALDMTIYQMSAGFDTSKVALLHCSGDGECRDGRRMEIEFQTKNGYRIPTEVISCRAPSYKGGARILAIARDITDRKAAEQMYELLTDSLKERVKELQCLYKVSSLCSDPSSTLGDVIHKVVSLLPAGWKYPQITRARIMLDDRMAATEGYAETEWKMSAEVIVSGRVEGKVEVCYMEPRPQLDEGPFMKEEWDLINAVATKLGEVTERIRAQEELVFTNESLSVTKGYLETALKRMETLNSELKSAHDEAESARIKAVKEKDSALEATFLKDKFVSLVVHDLKSPFSTIVSLLNLLLEDKENELAPRHRDILTKTAGSGANMLKMIDELLDISRLQSGVIKPRRQFVDARFLVADVLNTHAAVAERKGVELVNGLIAETRIYVDVGLFHEVLNNLVTNAIKFTRKGGVVQIFKPDRKGSILAISDTGIGVSQDMMTDLFRQDIKTTSIGTSGEKGTGLGLPYSLDIMKAHGGSIYVESQEGVGSVFYIHLATQRPLVLLVDDDEDFRKIISTQLAQVEVDIVEVADGKSGLEIAKERRPHLVILDLLMPQMTGLEMIREIRGDKVTGLTPILVVTSSGEREREEAFRVGASDLVGKEMLNKELGPRVKRLLNIGAFLT
ncbi:MAG: PAS domain S-box protein [Nitrospinota bacterium]|nr:PAS domain S-box protein [Nitrospinota bacterium]